MRLMPVVMTAAGALLLLKVAGLATHTSYLFVPDARAESAPETKPAETAKAVEPAKSEGHAEEGAAAPQPRPTETKLATEPEVSPSEKAILESLQKRRESLNTRAAELDMRENLLKAAQKKLEDRLAELKQVEKSVSDIDDKRAEEDRARLKNLVVMYENMKVKEAAAIFDKLDPDVLLDVAFLMKPNKLSDVMGKMAPDQAQKLTVALAHRGDADRKPAAVAAGELPKIEGRLVGH